MTAPEKLRALIAAQRTCSAATCCSGPLANALEVLLRPVNLNGIPIQTARALEHFHESLIEEMMRDE